MPDDYTYQERAAILEFEAGLSRLDAEAGARCCCARKNHLAAKRAPDHPEPENRVTAAPPQPPFDPAANPRPQTDQIERDDPGAEYPRREPAGRADKTTAPYAVAAARASPVYLESRRALAEILINNRLKGATA